MIHRVVLCARASEMFAPLVEGHGYEPRVELIGMVGTIPSIEAPE